MGFNKNPRVKFNCDYCGKESTDKPSHYKRKKRHFCSNKCYSLFRKYKLPTEEQHRFGTGESAEVVSKKRKARSKLNHAIRDGKIQRKPCVVCGTPKSEGHHEDYDKPLEVVWLCFKHHRKYHENPELLETKK